MYAIQPMQGHIDLGPGLLLRGGFQPGGLGDQPFELGKSLPIWSARSEFSAQTQDLLDKIDQDAAGIQRFDITGDVNDVVKTLGLTLTEFKRAITTSISAFPVRENLEAEAKILIPLETPVRNMLPRTPGAGLSSQWRQATSLGGGYAPAAAIDATGGGAGTSQILTGLLGTSAPAQQSGWGIGDTIFFQRLNVTKVITAISTNVGANTTTVTFVGSVTTVIGDSVMNLTLLPGAVGRDASGVPQITGDQATPRFDIQSFFPETGAPEDRHTYYVNKLAAYKLLGAYGSITGFAQAAGAN